MIRNLHVEEQPREKLAALGPQALTEIELLAILLRTGTKEKDVLELSREVLNHFNAREVSRKTYDELLQFKGIKKAKATQIVAAFEFARRATLKRGENIFLCSSKDVISYAKPEFEALRVEKVIGIFIDTKNKIIKKEVLHEGSIHYSLIEPRKIIKKVLDYGASGLFLLHNHPSGDATPSREDKEVTQELKEVCEKLEIRFLDHIIMGDKPFSFFDHGLL